MGCVARRPRTFFETDARPAHPDRIRNPHARILAATDDCSMSSGTARTRRAPNRSSVEDRRHHPHAGRPWSAHPVHTTSTSSCLTVTSSPLKPQPTPTDSSGSTRQPGSAGDWIFPELNCSWYLLIDRATRVRELHAEARPLLAGHPGVLADIDAFRPHADSRLYQLGVRAVRKLPQLSPAAGHLRARQLRPACPGAPGWPDNSSGHRTTLQAESRQTQGGRSRRTCPFIPEGAGRRQAGFRPAV